MGSHSQQQQSRRRQIPAAPRRQCCFSFAAYARSLMDHLRRCGVRVEPGLSEMELGHLESQLGLLFPPDLRAILTEGLPTGSSFPDWRHEPAASLRARIQQPLADLCAQVRRNRFWCDKWGDRPSGGEQAAAMAAAALERVAPLVPVYGNCYIPSSGSAGNPVLLVQSGEVSVVGNDVADFFEREVFHGDQEEDPNSRLLDEEDSSSSSSCLMGLGRSSDAGADKDREKISSSSLWGMRSLDFLARNPETLLSAFRRKKGISRSMAGTRSAEASPRPSVSSTASSNGGAAEPPRRSLDVVSRRKNHNPKGVVLEALLGFTMAAPAWAAKKPKHIDFWSDLCAQPPQLDDPKPQSSAQAPPPPAVPAIDIAHKSIAPAPADNAAQSSDLGAQVALTPASSANRSTAALPDRPKSPQISIQSEQQRWLHGYLDDMAGRLRIAGWKEDEICEMMVPLPPPSDDPVPRSSSSNAIVPSGKQSRQAVIQGLVFKVQELSDSLKRSGWSVQEVAEAFNSTTLSSSPKVLPTFGCIAAR